MLNLTTEIFVKGLTGKEITDFLLQCDDRQYQKWWPGVHLQFHTRKQYPGNAGNVVYMDEFVGKNRVKMKGIVLEIMPGKKLRLQLIKIVKLPVRLLLEFEDKEGGVFIKHIITAGFNGIGKQFDPLLKLYFNDDFRKAMDEHVKTEFPKLKPILHPALIPS